jgi:hypothetical protein
MARAWWHGWRLPCGSVPQWSRWLVPLFLLASSRWKPLGIAALAGVAPAGGNRRYDKTGMNWLGSFAAFAWNAVFLENYVNAGAPQAQERYFDDFVVSTQRIGC